MTHVTPLGSAPGFRAFEPVFGHYPMKRPASIGCARDAWCSKNSIRKSTDCVDFSGLITIKAKSSLVFFD